MLSLFSFPWTVLLIGILSLVMDKYTPVNSMSIKLITLEKGNQNDKKDIPMTSQFITQSIFSSDLASFTLCMDADDQTVYSNRKIKHKLRDYEIMQE